MSPWEDPPEVRDQIDEILRGKASPMDRLLIHYLPALRHKMRQHLAGKSSADDCRQDILLRLCTKLLSSTLRKYDPARPFAPLLFCALDYALLDHIAACNRAAAMRTREDYSLNPDELVSEATAEAPERMRMPEDARMEARATLIALQEKLFLELTEVEYAIYVLFYREELASKEIAELMGMTRRQVDTAREKMLRKCKEFRTNTVHLT